MNQDRIEEALAMAQRQHNIFLASSDIGGVAHIAVAKRIIKDPEGSVQIFLWPCPTTIANLQQNKYISLVTWDEGKRVGFQLEAEVVSMREFGMLDGYSQALEHAQSFPQSYWQLVVNIYKVMEFKDAIHSDDGL